MNETTHKVEQHRTLGERICATLRNEINALGFAGELPSPIWEEAQFNLLRDPALGQMSLEGVWLTEQGGKLGSIVIHHDDSFFAEYDIIRPHPSKAKWFVEAVSAWGRRENIKAEARLLPMPAD